MGTKESVFLFWVIMMAYLTCCVGKRNTLCLAIQRGVYEIH